MPVCDTPGMAPSSSAASVVLPSRASPSQPEATLGGAPLSASVLPFGSLESLQEPLAAVPCGLSGAEALCLARRTAGCAAFCSTSRLLVPTAGAVAV